MCRWPVASASGPGAMQRCLPVLRNSAFLDSPWSTSRALAETAAREPFFPSLHRPNALFRCHHSVVGPDMGDVPGEVVTTDSAALSLPPSGGEAEGEMTAHRIK